MNLERIFENVLKESEIDTVNRKNCGEFKTNREFINSLNWCLKKCADDCCNAIFTVSFSGDSYTIFLTSNSELIVSYCGDIDVYKNLEDYNNKCLIPYMRDSEIDLDTPLGDGNEMPGCDSSIFGDVIFSNIIV